MKTRFLLLLLLLVLLPVLLPAAAQEDDAATNPFLAMLRYVPDTPDARAWLTWGDYAAWLQSWDVPRPASLEELDALLDAPRAYWMFIMPNQTLPPDALGVSYLFNEGEARRAYYGFDIFDLNRWLDAGPPPDAVAVLEHALDPAQIGAALEASGYVAEPVGGENLLGLTSASGTLYSIREDYEIDMRADLRTAMLGQRNRIALLDDGTMLIGRATEPVMNALRAGAGQTARLADAPEYAALAEALLAEAAADYGDLLGVVVPDLSGENAPSVNNVLGADATQELIDALREELGGDWLRGPLPEYDLVGFATYHNAGAGATFLALAVVFPQGADAAAAADELAFRLQNYVSVTLRRPLDDRWTFHAAAGIEAGGRPVALVAMRVDDPPPTPEGEPLARAGVFRWIDLIVRRDLLFLANWTE